MVVVREVRPFCLFWIMAFFCVAESGLGGSTTGGRLGGAMFPTPSGSVGVSGLGVRFASLLNERWRGVVRIMPIPVPFLEFLKSGLMIVRFRYGSERALRVKSEGA